MLKNFITRQACLEDISYIDFLQKKNAEDLSFYPKIVFEREIENNRIILAEYNSEPCGYLYYGAFGMRLKIHQACIQYDLRGKLYGASLVSYLLGKAEERRVSSVHLRCGSDIEANGFWKEMGFYCEAVTNGGVRRMRDINCWRNDLQESLFITEIDPSSKKKDSSIWRKGKGKGDRMARGKAKDEYRKSVILKASLL